MTVRAERRLTRRGRTFGLFLMVALLWLKPDLHAHKVSSVSLISHLDTEKKTYLLDAAMEVVPSIDPAVNDEISPEDAARIFAEEYLEVLFDQKAVIPKLEISVETSSDEDTPAELQRRQVLVKMTGAFPEGAEEFLLYLDPTCPMAVVMVVLKDDRPSRRMQVILAGEYSRPVNVLPLMEGDPFTAKEVSPAPAAPSAEKEKGDAKEGEDPKSKRDPISEPKGKKSSLVAGWLSFFGHSSLPLLFPVGMLLLTLKRKAVIVQLAGMLVGQSLAIALAAWGVAGMALWTLSFGGVVFAILCFEAIFHRECRWWRIVMSLVAGFFSGILISGAAAFPEFFHSGNEVSIGSLIGFVTGAELGVILSGMVAAAVLLVLSRFDWYRTSVVQPLAVLLGGYGMYLGFERFL